MKIAVAVLLLCFGVALAARKRRLRRPSSEDSSEYGLGGGPVGTNCSCGYTNKEGSRIVGGRGVLVNEYPLIGGLAYDKVPGFIFCGSTVITKRHLVSAAHCNPGKKKSSVVLAEHDLRSTRESKTVTIPIERFINHEEFDKNGDTENDIAIVLLTQDIPFGPTIGPACFPAPGHSVQGKKIRVIGWGTKYAGGRQAKILQKVDLDVVDLSVCSNAYTGITEAQMCTYTLGKDACQGDSGGPVIYRDPTTNRYTFVGVVSYGTGCGEPDTPSINADVVAYRDWILTKVAETDPTATTCQNVQPPTDEAH